MLQYTLYYVYIIAR